MSSAGAPVDLVLIWHHHQPDYRHPGDGVAALPWVRLHATKDYLGMALRLERFPGVKAAFNFVPSLLDQLEGAISGTPDPLFDAMAQAPERLAPEVRDDLARRTRFAPPWAFDRWPAYAAIARRVAAAASPGAALKDDELIAMECWFLLAWLDPMFHVRPEAAAALAALPHADTPHRDGLLALHHGLLAEVVPAYRRLAERGQIELSVSPYYHPILPLLVDHRHALRSRPSAALPLEPFAAPDDARAQIRSALERNARAFGRRPVGLWPSEGSVSPESVEIAAGEGVGWLASDEGVLWRSLPPGSRGREALYRPWSVRTAAGAVALLFRDHELSDRIGFVYQRWDPAQAARDFLDRVRRIGVEHAGPEAPLVTIVLDGENCWEHYIQNGGPFLNALYGALDGSGEIRTLTPVEAVAAHASPTLESLHSGSWIDADFHIWIGHPEKNLAWDHVARARRALIEAGVTPESRPDAWEALYAAEGSDWFWWFGEDHATEDRAIFDALFREHVHSVYERAGIEPPAALHVPITRAGSGTVVLEPIGSISPVIDGRETHFYEWHEAGRLQPDVGGSMHRAPGRVRRLHYGFDADSFYLRLDVEGPTPANLTLEFLAPRGARVNVTGLADGKPSMDWMTGDRREPLPAGRVAAGQIVEMALPRAALGLGPGAALEMLVHVMEDGRAVESIPRDGTLRITLPGPNFPADLWSA